MLSGKTHQLQGEAMHRIDEKLMKLDAHFEAANGEEKQSIQKEIKAWRKWWILCRFRWLQDGLFLLGFLGWRWIFNFRMDI